MSRRIYSIINNAFLKENDTLDVLVLGENKDLNQIINVRNNYYYLSENNAKPQLPNLININGQDIEQNLYLMFNIILDLNPHNNVHHTHNIGEQLNIPICNLFIDSGPGIKKEIKFAMAPTLETCYNFFLKEDFSDDLYINNFTIINSLSDINSHLFKVIKNEY